MTPGRVAGTKNRNYPNLSLSDALALARAIQDEASGMPLSRLRAAELLNTTPSSSQFRWLTGSSRMYGLTTGGVNASEFGLTPLGEQATGADEVAELAALKAAVMNVAPYKVFFETFQGKKVPTAGPLKDFLMKSAAVDESRVDECIQHILEDARTAGLVKAMKGGDWIDLQGVPAANSPVPGIAEDTDPDTGGAADADDATTPSEIPESPRGSAEQSAEATKAEQVAAGGPKKVFIAHGKNRTPLEQLKKALDQFKVKYAVAVDEPNRGRPISRKVADLMEKECSSGIFIFTADERFLQENDDGDQVEVWRPSENVIYELGAASILYENRIVIFKETDVSFPSDFRDLGYIPFEKDQLATEIGPLFAELVALDILEVRAKG